jgi:hypothetical protein
MVTLSSQTENRTVMGFFQAVCKVIRLRLLNRQAIPFSKREYRYARVFNGLVEDDDKKRMLSADMIL